MTHSIHLSSSGPRARWSGSLVRAATFSAVGIVASLWPASAQASRAYAYVLSSGFGFGGGCPSCHNNQVGGLGTVTQPFGVTMMELGLKAADVSTLYEALTLLEPSNRDSDGDTISDFDELGPEGDPNDPTVSPEGAAPIPTTPAPVEPQPSTTAAPPASSTATPTPTSAPIPSNPSAPPSNTKSDGGCALLKGQPGANGWGSLLVFVGLAYAVRRRHG